MYSFSIETKIEIEMMFGLVTMRSAVDRTVNTNNKG